jgi:hypothetical protein
MAQRHPHRELLRFDEWLNSIGGDGITAWIKLKVIRRATRYRHGVWALVGDILIIPTEQ